jgi:hypothetical protein
MSTNRTAEPDRNRIGLGTSLVIMAAIATECGLVVAIDRCYAAVPSQATPAYAEAVTRPAVVLWTILGSLAAFAIRKCSVRRLAGQLAISCVLLTWRLSVRGDTFDRAAEVLWPVTCFGFFFVAPHLLVRFSRAKDSVLVLADAAVVALLTYVFAAQPYVPKI